MTNADKYKIIKFKVPESTYAAVVTIIKSGKKVNTLDMHTRTIDTNDLSTNEYEVIIDE